MQTLYQGWNGRWPFRHYLYIGITNSPSRRMREHRANSDWMLEARVIRMKRYPDRESVREAERQMIIRKRPEYNIQHNRHEIEIASPEDIAARAAALSFGILAARSLADIGAMWWVRHLAARQGVTVELPPRPNRFTESSAALTMFQVCSKMATGHDPRDLLAAPGDDHVPAAPEYARLGAPPALSAEPAQPVRTFAPSPLGMLLLTAYCLTISRTEQASEA
ncbi:MAG TPA: hypothetical protein VEJ42_06510 [Streptosporangiaceae bacterium]|nr:hypothetical protein [Streptosporangiaceae bacterium]